MINKLKSTLALTPGWLAVVLVLVLQGGTLAYTFGKLSDRVAENQIEITSLTRTEKNYNKLSEKLAVISQRLKDDEKLLNSIADTVGARK